MESTTTIFNVKKPKINFKLSNISSISVLRVGVNYVVNGANAIT